uniref:Uncharacterized protein n=1 Tax=Arundo donax TaxID=35708 RepID=A0A0A8Y418_ARUDO
MRGSGHAPNSRFLPNELHHTTRCRSDSIKHTLVMMFPNTPCCENDKRIQTMAKFLRHSRVNLGPPIRQ